MVSICFIDSSETTAVMMSNRHLRFHCALRITHLVAKCQGPHSDFLCGEFRESCKARIFLVGSLGSLSQRFKVVHSDGELSQLGQLGLYMCMSYTSCEKSKFHIIYIYRDA